MTGPPGKFQLPVLLICGAEGPAWGRCNHTASTVGRDITYGLVEENFQEEKLSCKSWFSHLKIWDKCSIHSKTRVPGWEHSKSMLCIYQLVVDKLGIP